MATVSLPITQETFRYLFPGCRGFASPVVINFGQLVALKISCRLQGGNYVATRDLVLTDINGKVIGKISLEGTAKQVDPANFNINVKIDGTFKGPTDIERVSDYWFPLTHDGKGKVVGQYVQSLFPTAGPPITLTCHLKYEWKNEKRMPFDQVVTTHFLDTSESVDRSGVRMFGVNAVAVGHKTLTYEELVGLKVGTILD